MQIIENYQKQKDVPSLSFIAHSIQIKQIATHNINTDGKYPQIRYFILFRSYTKIIHRLNWKSYNVDRFDLLRP